MKYIMYSKGAGIIVIGLKKILRGTLAWSLLLVIFSSGTVNALETGNEAVTQVDSGRTEPLITEPVVTEKKQLVTNVPVVTEKPESQAVKPEVTVTTEPEIKKTEEYGIDISRYQGDINWTEFKQNDVSFVILRAGTSRYGIDAKFEEYYKNLNELGIKTGAYFYCSATTLEEFRRDAFTFLKFLEGKDMKMPVYLDLEDSVQPSVGKQALTTYAVAALNIIDDAGYTTGIYSNKNWFTNYIDRELVAKAGYEVWWAQYPSMSAVVNPLDYDLRHVCGMWQYSSLGSIKGIGTSVDLNIAYKIYPLDNTAQRPNEKWITYAKPSLRIRSGPGMGYGQIGNVQPNSIITVTDIRQEDGYKWGKVNHDGNIGWCAIDYATIITQENQYLLSYDLNGDNIIDMNDQFQIKKGVLLDGIADKSADINNDGVVNVFDCQRIKRQVIE